MKRILVTNDDSLSYEGIKVLAKIAKDYADEVIIVAPHTERSACSHSLTLKNTVYLYNHIDLIEGVKTFTLDATPSDCVKFAKDILEFDFDYVFSGINNGYNLADDICYSGTASAALEAEFLGKKGFAFSTEVNDLTGSIYIKEALDFIFNSDLINQANMFNINLPNNSKGIKITKQGKRSFNGKFFHIKDNIYEAKPVDLNNRFIVRESNSDDDFVAIENNYVSISLLKNQMNVK